jgi:hypothetical protein
MELISKIKNELSREKGLIRLAGGNEIDRFECDFKRKFKKLYILLN